MKMAGITGAAGGPDTCRKTVKHGASGHDSALRKVALKGSQSRDCGSFFRFGCQFVSSHRQCVAVVNHEVFGGNPIYWAKGGVWLPRAPRPF